MVLSSSARSCSRSAASRRPVRRSGRARARRAGGRSRPRSPRGPRTPGRRSRTAGRRSRRGRAAAPRIARPTSWLPISAHPLARTASSTAWASSARSSSLTGRPWHALRTPLATLARLNGSVTPLRFTTVSVTVSAVVKRLPHSGHCRRRRMLVPSAVAAGVDDAGVGVAAERAVHRGRLPSLSSWPGCPGPVRSGAVVRVVGGSSCPVWPGLLAACARICGELGEGVRNLLTRQPLPVDDLQRCNY